MKNTINKYFEVKVKLQKTMEDGQQKKVREQYVVQAATFGEAERRIAECLKPYIEGEFEVTDIKIAGYPISRASLKSPTSRLPVMDRLSMTIRMQTSSSRPRCHSLPWMKPLVKKRRPLSCIWYSQIRWSQQRVM